MKHFSHNIKPIYSHFGEHRHNGWLFPTISCNSGTSWGFCKDKKKDVIHSETMSYIMYFLGHLHLQIILLNDKYS